MADPILQLWRHVHPRRLRPAAYWAARAAEIKVKRLARRRRKKVRV